MKFEELKVWMESKLLLVEIYKNFGRIKDFGFRDQICRAGLSIMNNIAEGYDRGSKANLTNFLNIALGSASEVKSMFYAAKDLEYISQEVFDNLIASISKLVGMLVNFKKSINIKS